MSSVHGHEVLHMMEGNSYTKASLLTAIDEKFGKTATFHTCSKQNMSASELVEFLTARGKFKPIQESCFTVDTTKICNH